MAAPPDPTKVFPAKRESEPERQLAFLINAYRLPVALREYRFDKTRRWRFDFAWPEFWLAVEVEGGIWIRGAHVRGRHYESDLEKYNAAALAGWTVLRVTPGMIGDNRAIDLLMDAFKRMRGK